MADRLLFSEPIESVGACHRMFELPHQFGHVTQMWAENDKLFVVTSAGVALIIPKEVLDTARESLQHS